MAAPKQPWLLQYRSSKLFIISTVGIGLFTDLFLYGLIVPILPFILEERVNVPKSDVQKYTSALLAAYAGASVISSIPAGIIADKTKARQTPFLAGLTALLLATILLFVGKSLAVLLVARIFQGVSAAVVWTVGLAMIKDTVGSEQLGVTIGSIFSFISIGELAAPVLGGVLYEKAGYGGVFGLGFAFIVIDFLMRCLVIEKKTAVRYKDEHDVEDTVDDESDNDDEANEANEQSPLIAVTKDDAGRWKIQNEQPTWIKKFPIAYVLSDPRLITAELVAFTQATLLAVFDSTIPTEAQDLFGFDSLKAGLLFAPLVLPYLLLGPVFGKFVDKTGPKPAAVIGMAFLVPVLVCLRIPDAGGKAEIIKFCAITALCGLGLGLISAPSIVEASYVTEQYHKHNTDFFGEAGPYAQLYSINSMVFSLGLTVGPVVSGALKDSIGYGNMNAVVAGLCAIVSILSFVFLGGTPKMLKN